MRPLQSFRFSLASCTILGLSLTALACSAYQQDGPADDAQSGSGGTTVHASGGSGGSTATPSAGTTSVASGGSLAAGGTASASGGASTGKSAALPLIIDQFFSPSGYMADAQNGNATMTPLTEMGDTTCDGNRASPDARGVCRIVTFTTFGTSPTLTWGGVYWQFPDKNWGEQPGLQVDPGATKIAFKARGEKGGEKVGFFAGGLGLDGMTHQPTAKNYDGFYVSGDDNTKTLTTEWTAYEIDLTGKTYDKGVLGAFGWGVGLAGNTLPVKFYLDDIAWEK